MSPAAKHPLPILVFIALLATAWPMLACAQQNVLDISGLDPISIVSWNGSGGLMGEDDYCILSYREFWFGAFSRQYDVAAYHNGYVDGDGDFALEHVSGDQLKVSLGWRGNATGGNFVTLRPQETSGDVTGRQDGASDCSQPEALATIRIDISATTLATAQAGTYSGTFQIDVWQFTGNGSGRYPSSGPIYQSFSVTIPELVQITNLDDIDLGSFDGVNDLTQGDDICIFRNGFGDFRIKASGGSGTADAFLLSNGAGQIPYQVALKDDAMASFVTVAAGQWLGGLNGHGSQNCGGGTNASFQVTALASDMMTATSGTYSGTLYLTVEPD